MTRDEATEAITRMRLMLEVLAPVAAAWRLSAGQACVWAARLLDSGAECVSPDNEIMVEEMEMSEAWQHGQPVLLTKRGEGENETI